MVCKSYHCVPCPSVRALRPHVSVDIDFVGEWAGGRFGLAEKAVNVLGGAGKLVAAFKEAIGTQDAVGGVEMCVDHAAVISMCIETNR